MQIIKKHTKKGWKRGGQKSGWTLNDIKICSSRKLFMKTQDKNSQPTYCVLPIIFPLSPITLSLGRVVNKEGSSVNKLLSSNSTSRVGWLARESGRLIRLLSLRSSHFKQRKCINTSSGITLISLPTMYKFSKVFPSFLMVFMLDWL